MAVKVQYPGVGRSIHSDIDNLMRMMRVANVFPRGLYIEQAVAVAKVRVPERSPAQSRLGGGHRWQDHAPLGCVVSSCEQ